MKIATFFGAARIDEESKEYLDTIKIGTILSEKGYKVRNGGYGGLMEAVSIGCNRVKGEVDGITCSTFGFTKGNPYLSNCVVAKDIYDRLRILIDESDIFIVQIGGIGTLSELSLTLDECRKRKNKPKIFLIGDKETWEWFFRCPCIQSNVKKLVTIIPDVEQLQLLL